MQASTPATGGLAFTIGRVPVRIRASFFVSAAVLGLLGRYASPAMLALWIAICLVSVLWHELGHALAAICFGGKPAIELALMGGETEVGAAAPLAWWKSCVISLAGPAAGLLFGGVVWLFARGTAPESETASVALQWVLWTNVGWSLLNLLPVLPYDGGLALSAALRALLPRRGEEVAYVVTIVTGGAACAVALAVGMYWGAYLAGGGALAAVRWLANQRFERRLDAAWGALHAGRRDEAAVQTAAILRGAGGEWLYGRAVELTAWIAVHRGDTAAAREALRGFPRGYEPSDLLQATLDTMDGRDTSAALRAIDRDLLLSAWQALIKAWLGHDAEARVGRLINDHTAPALDTQLLRHFSVLLFEASEFAATLIVTTRAFAAHGTPDEAYNAACALSRLGRAEEALPWLERAIDAGYTNLAHLQDDDDLAPVRALSGFAPLAARLAPAANP